MVLGLFGRGSCAGLPRQRIGTERAEIGGGLQLVVGERKPCFGSPRRQARFSATVSMST